MMGFNFLQSFFPGLGPGRSTLSPGMSGRIVVTGSHFVVALPFVDFDRWLIELELVGLIFIVAICVDVGGDGGDGLILIDVD